MQRRRLLQLGLGAAAAFALIGGGVALLRSGLVDGRPSEPSRSVLKAVARAVLDGSLPADEREHEGALLAHLDRVQATIDGFPAAMRTELSQLLGLLSSTAGRLALTGVRNEWSQASVEEIQAALKAMNLSSLTVRQQAFHALRDITNGAFFADPSAWSLMGYPGPRSLA